MFIGWNVSLFAFLVTWLSKEAKAVSSGGSKHFMLFLSKIIKIDDNNPIADDSTYPSTPVICQAKKNFELVFKFNFELKMSGELINVFLCKPPSLANAAFSNPGIFLKTFFCSS